MTNPRFLVDVMLGRLARWLRFLGYDTAYEADASDPELVRRSLAEGRLLLTRDRRLLERYPHVEAFRVESDDPLRQLRQIVDALGLRRTAGSPPRCTACNGALQPSGVESVRDRIPPYVASTRRCFGVCKGCGRIYWEGTHLARMERDLEEALEGPLPGAEPGSGLR